MNGNTYSGTYTYDIVIVGAGISGINAAYRIQTLLPHATFTILENRHEIGGTWSLFKYPGIRSDSDLHTFGFPFNPWEKRNSIATGESIIEYLNNTVKKFGLDQKLDLRHKVERADWRSSEQRWRLEVDHEGTRKIYWAKYVIMGTGYYNYEKPLQPEIQGLDSFQGTLIHPQFWPEDLDYRGKKMVVIGSGATTVTIIPAVVEKGVGSVVQLQRSPSYIVSLPQQKEDDPLPLTQRFLPHSLSLYILRIYFLVYTVVLYAFCRGFPGLSRRMIRNEACKQLPKDFQMDPHLSPTYQPWDQRMCFVPDADYFKAICTGRARIVTDTIKRVVEDGIELDGGEKLEADIIVTATGLNLRVCGGVPFTIDNKPIHFPSCFLWHTTMFSGVPNLFTVIGYVNAAWTLGSDSTARMFVRLYKHMEENGYTSATPTIKEEETMKPLPVLGLTSTYIQRAMKTMPKSGSIGPWKPRSNPIADNWKAKRGDLRQGLKFETVAT